MSTFSDLKFELITPGEQDGAWGTTTNRNIGTAIEEAITGSADITFSSADVTLTLSDTNAAQVARNLRLNLIGTSGGARQLILGAGCQINKLYLVKNNLLDTVTIKNTTGTGVDVPADATQLVFNDGVNVLNAVSGSGGGGGTVTSVGGTGTVNGITLSGTVTNTGNLTLGGTLSGVNLTTQVTGTLPVAKGGTGRTTLTANNVLIGNGTSAVSFVAPGASGNVLASNGTSWISVAGSGGGGTVTSVGGTGTVNGITLSGTVTNTGNLTLGGTLSGVNLTTQVTGTLPVANGGTGSTSLTGAGIVTIADTQTITGQKTFSGQARFTGLGGGASFGENTPSGNFAAFFKPRTTVSGIAGAGFQNNGGNEGAGFATSLSATPLMVFGFGTATTPGSIPPVGSITSNGVSTAYNTLSDYRLKTDVVPLANAITRLKLLQPKNFIWISAPEQGVAEGFIAHELQTTVPDAVFGEKDAVSAQGQPKYQGVDTSMLVPLLTAALQEAVARIEALETAIATLQAK